MNNILKQLLQMLSGGGGAQGVSGIGNIFRDRNITGMSGLERNQRVFNQSTANPLASFFRPAGGMSQAAANKYDTAYNTPGETSYINMNTKPYQTSESTSGSFTNPFYEMLGIKPTGVGGGSKALSLALSQLVQQISGGGGPKSLPVDYEPASSSVNMMLK